MSSCKKCSVDTNFHHFEFISRLPTGDAVYTTCPAKGKQRSMKEDSIPDYVAHMDEASTSGWVWVIDCSGLESFHMPSVSLLQKFMGVIQDRYKYVLKKVYIININWKMHMILSLVKPFMKDEAKERLSIVTSKLQFFAHGFTAEMMIKLNK